MKKIFALILLLAVSLLAFTACSTITASDVDYTKSSSYGCDCSFSVKNI